MEEYPTRSSSLNNLHDIPDLNVTDEIEGMNCEDDQLHGESSMCNDDEVQATNEVESLNLTIDEMEKRLELYQLVENEHIAHALYSKYARAKGFSVRKARSIRAKDGSLRGKFFVCSCDGKKDEKRSKNRIPDYQKTSFRCECKAKLKIARQNGGPWKVTAFTKEHTHELYVQDQTYLLRSHRNLSDDQELLLTSMVNNGIPVSKAVGFLENLAQGREHVGFLPKDAYNCLYKKKRVENGDAMEVFLHFTKKLNSESRFFSTMEVDDEKKLKNFFFRDYRCSSDYEDFCDVISFDTTYRTNKYELVCAPFIGINHHNENVFFGFAFLSDETECSFEWLFRTFLESINGKQPGIIFTDQCQAMMKAIGKVFPCAQHRLCQWHINKNASPRLKSDKSIKGLWNKCMSSCESEDEFEVTWKQMMGCKIGDRSWFNVMYNLRHKWATTFSNHIFSAGLLATSRSEGTNFALKHQVGNKTSSLLDCVIGYEKVQSAWRLKEKENDTLCRHNKPSPFAPHNPLLKHASNIYTFNIFMLFEKEIRDTMSYEIPQLLSYVGNSVAIYKVKPYIETLMCRIVEYDGQKKEIRCSCHCFETVGILCSHVLKVFDLVSVQHIPEKYILRRWTKNAKSDVGDGENKNESLRYANRGNSHYVSELAFVNRATKESHDLITRGKAHVDGMDVVFKHINLAKKELDVLFGNMKLNESVAPDVPIMNENCIVDDVPVRDPSIAKTRGITNINKRPWEEKSRKKKGKCTGKATKSTKVQGQSSQMDRDNCLSQEASKFQQYDFYQPYAQSFQGFCNNDWRLPQ